MVNLSQENSAAVCSRFCRVLSVVERSLVSVQVQVRVFK